MTASIPRIRQIKTDAKTILPTPIFFFSIYYLFKTLIESIPEIGTISDGIFNC